MLKQQSLLVKTSLPFARSPVVHDDVCPGPGHTPSCTTGQWAENVKEKNTNTLLPRHSSPSCTWSIYRQEMLGVRTRTVSDITSAHNRQPPLFSEHSDTNTDVQIQIQMFRYKYRCSNTNTDVWIQIQNVHKQAPPSKIRPVCRKCLDCMQTRRMSDIWKDAFKTCHSV